MNNLFNEETSINALLYILNKMGGSCDMHKISKILYYADQEHLSKYGRTITGDVYIAMPYGPVPSKIYDIMKAVRGDSFFSYPNDKFKFIDRQSLRSLVKADEDYLSESDIECLDKSIDKCKTLNFRKLSDMSHGTAWHKNEGGEMSYADILEETGESEEYIEYITKEMEFDNWLKKA